MVLAEGTVAAVAEEAEELLVGEPAEALVEAIVGVPVEATVPALAVVPGAVVALAGVLEDILEVVVPVLDDAGGRGNWDSRWALEWVLMNRE